MPTNISSKKDRQLSTVLSISCICLGISEWVDPSESSARWKWLQQITNDILGLHGHAKLLIIVGIFWLIWNLFFLLKGKFKRR